VKSAIAFFVSGSARLQELMDTVIKEAAPLPTTSSDMKQADEIIRTGISDELIDKAINSKNVKSLSNIGAHEVAVKIINPEIDKYDTNALPKKESDIIEKFSEQLEFTLAKIDDLYKAVKYETRNSYTKKWILGDT
jgi:hypothetical protein